MKHLTIEALARLVNEPASPQEAEHLAGCEVCTSELASLMAQTESLAALPDILPPRGDWEVLAARLPDRRAVGRVAHHDLRVDALVAERQGDPLDVG